MTINTKGGKKHKKNANKHREDNNTNTKNIELAEGSQEYAKVLARLGGSRLSVDCTDGKKRQAIIPGKFKSRRRIWLNAGDILLISIGSTGNPDVCSIDKKYLPREITVLKQKGLINFENDKDTENDNFEFEFKKEDEVNLKIEPQIVKELDFGDDEYEYYSDEENNNTSVTNVNKQKDNNNSDSLDLDDI